MDPDATAQRLQTIGTLADGDVPVLEALVLLAAIEDGAIDASKAEQHFSAMRQALAASVNAYPQGEESVVKYRLDRLNAVIINQFGYEGEEDAEDKHFLNVIEHRRGIPVAIGVLYLELAQSQHWAATGLNFPGHFLLRLDHGAERLIVDPANGKAMEAHDLRQLLKSLIGEKAELNHHYYDPISARDVVLRFCNHRKTRSIAESNYAAALTIIGHELWIAPNEPRLYYDAAILYAKIGRITEALDALRQFIELSDDVRDIAEAKNLIRSLQLGLH